MPKSGDQKRFVVLGSFWLRGVFLVFVCFSLNVPNTPNAAKPAAIAIIEPNGLSSVTKNESTAIGQISRLR